MAVQLKIDLSPIEIENRPAHVPAHLVRDLRWAHGEYAVTYDEPYQHTEELLRPEIPRLLWMPDIVAGQPGVGAWVITHYQDIARVYQDPDLFSTDGAAAYQRLIGEDWPCIPLGIDPPDHFQYRAMLNPYFSPKAIDAMEESIRANAQSFIDGVVERGSVDFAWEFARVFPVRVFMDLMGFPFEMFDRFLDWEMKLLHGSNDEKIDALRSVLAYLREFIEEQKKNPGQELVGRIVTSEVFGRPINDDEMIGTVFFLWQGGLDTVASSLSMMFRRLAIDTKMQQTLRDDPAMIPEAVEEFLRVQPLVNSQRVVKRDFEWHDQLIKAGDWIMCFVTAGNFDSAEFKCPREVQLDRQPNRHFTLAGGPHRCLGSHLARREMRVALEEWFRRVPPFKLDPGDPRLIHPGLRAVKHVNLVW